MAICIGITIIAIGVVICVWAGVYNHGRATTTMGNDIGHAREENRTVEQSIAEAQSNVDYISESVSKLDKQLNDGVGNISESISKLDKQLTEGFNDLSGTVSEYDKLSKQQSGEFNEQLGGCRETLEELRGTTQSGRELIEQIRSQRKN